MPLYDFRCDKCNWEWEEFLRHSNDPAPLCPECGGAWTSKIWKQAPKTLHGPYGKGGEDAYNLLHKRIPDPKIVVGPATQRSKLGDKK